MPNHLHSTLIQQGFSAHEATLLIEHGQELELPTRHILCNQGECSSHIYFVLEGLCHASFLTDEGQQFSKAWYLEQEWVMDFEGIIKTQPSTYLLETLSACQIFCLPIEILRDWKAAQSSLYLKLLENYLIHQENKDRFKLLYSAKERYQLISMHNPQLEQSVTDHQMAAYLGIAPVQLSRIKSYLHNENE